MATFAPSVKILVHRRNVRNRPPIQGPSVKRILFEPETTMTSDNSTEVAYQLIEEMTKRQSLFWNFDFKEGRPFERPTEGQNKSIEWKKTTTEGTHQEMQEISSLISQKKTVVIAEKDTRQKMQKIRSLNSQKKTIVVAEKDTHQEIKKITSLNYQKKTIAENLTKEKQITDYMPSRKRRSHSSSSGSSAAKLARPNPSQETPVGELQLEEGVRSQPEKV